MQSGERISQLLTNRIKHVDITDPEAVIQIDKSLALVTFEQETSSRAVTHDYLAVAPWTVWQKGMGSTSHRTRAKPYVVY